MRKTILLCAALLTAAGAAAQNTSSYFMEGTTLRSQLNPAFAPLRGYVNIPGLGGLDANMNGNLSLDKVLFPRNGKLVTIFDNSVTSAEALSGLNANNLLGVDTRVNVIGFGAFTSNHKNFWSFDLNVRADAQLEMPYSLFDFLKTGRSQEIRNIGVTSNAYLEAAFTYSFPVMHDKIYIGIRGKFLAGAARGKLTYDRFDASLGEDSWLINAEGRLDLTAAGIDVTTMPTGDGRQVFKPGDISLKPTKPAGYGFAVDLGASYDILPNLQASLAVNDLGFISWNSKYNLSANSLKELRFTGVEVNQSGTSTPPKFDIDILEFERTEAQSTTKMLQASVNAGIEYEVWRHKIGIGLLYTARIRPYQTLHNLTGSVNFHPIRWFTVTGSYSVIDNRGHAVGLALNLCPNWINFFVATDILTTKHTPQFLPIKQNTVNVTLGLGIPIGRRSHRIKAYVYPKDRNYNQYNGIKPIESTVQTQTPEPVEVTSPAPVLPAPASGGIR